jgi:glycerophosphoryl diester phosphodiesterase
VDFQALKQKIQFLALLPLLIGVILALKLIFVTKDEIFVINHNPTLLNTNFEIKNNTYEFLARINFIDKYSNTIKPYLFLPKLIYYISIIRKYDKYGIVEIKDIWTIEQLKKIYELLIQNSDISKIIIIAFDYQNLEILRSLDKNISLQFLCSKYDVNTLNKCLKINCDLDIHYSQVNEKLIYDFHKNNLKVNVWTVDNLETAAILVKWEVDYITSNILE